QMSALSEIASAETTTDLRELEVKFLGKSGVITLLSREIGKLPNDEKPAFGQKVNTIRKAVQDVLDQRIQA
ncbi:hypothetical protein ACEV99_22775, partial [Vibrio parahaemolyticus]